MFDLMQNNSVDNGLFTGTIYEESKRTSGEFTSVNYCLLSFLKTYFHNCYHDNGHTYRLRVPDQVGESLGDFSNKVENKNEDHNEWANHSPCHLPEDVGFVADHKLNVLIKPGKIRR